TRYIMLAVENRNNTDERTMGELFFLIHDELQDGYFCLSPPKGMLGKSITSLRHLF
ncbi:MAG: hypothetical protein ACJAX4_004796, partial [Clostridium sp.]